MNRTLIAVAALLSLTLPAVADEIFLTIDNQSSQSAAFNSYPIGKDGEPVEDNIGSYGDILPGTKGEYKLDSLACELVLVAVIMADGSEMRTNVDLCTSRTLVITD